MVSLIPSSYVLVKASIPEGICSYAFIVELNQDLRNKTQNSYEFLEKLNMQYSDVTDICSIYGKFRIVDINRLPEEYLHVVQELFQEVNVIFFEQPIHEVLGTDSVIKPVNPKICVEIEYVHFVCELKKGESVVSHKIDMNDIIKMHII